MLVQPPNSEVVIESRFTPFAGLAWSDRPAISFQFHPEFSPEFAKALIEKRYDVVPDPDSAIASLDSPTATRLVTTRSRAVHALGYLLFWREGALHAQAFDESTFEMHGNPISVANAVGVRNL